MTAITQANPTLRGRTRSVVIVSVLSAALLVSACGKSSGGGPGGPPGGMPPALAQTAVPVGVIVAEPGDIAALMSFSATVESERNVVVFPQTTGLVHAVLAEEGDGVEENQVLLRLDDEDARIAVERARIELEKQRADSARTAELYHRELESQEAYENVLYQVNRARLTLREAEIALARTRIRAPVAGIISERNVEIGNRVGPSSEVYKPVTMHDLIAEVFVPGRTRQHIRVGQAAQITSDMLPGYMIEGVIKRINPVVDPQSGTVKVTVQLRDRDRKFRPGMFATVSLISERRTNALLVPKEALTYDGGRAYAFVVKDTVAKRMRLEIGLSNPREVQVLVGVTAGDSVVIVGQEGLRDGAKVRVVAKPFEPVPPEPKKASADSTAVDSTALKADTTGTAQADTTAGAQTDSTGS